MLKTTVANWAKQTLVITSLLHIHCTVDQCNCLFINMPIILLHCNRVTTRQLLVCTSEPQRSRRTIPVTRPRQASLPGRTLTRSRPPPWRVEDHRLLTITTRTVTCVGLYPRQWEGHHLLKSRLPLKQLHVDSSMSLQPQEWRTITSAWLPVEQLYIDFSMSLHPQEYCVGLQLSLTNNSNKVFCSVFNILHCINL